MDKQDLLDINHHSHIIIAGRGHEAKKEKGVSVTNEFTSELLSELNCDTAFTIPVFGGIAVPESVVVTWIIMAALILISIVLTRNLSVENPGKRQLVLETGYQMAEDFFGELLGKNGCRYLPYLLSVLIFIAVANLIGLLGFKPPTKDMGVTAGMAILSIIIVEFAGIRQKGVKKWMKSFVEPLPVVAPINLLEVFTRPLSLCMRLFGNVLGSFVVMELLKLVVPVFLPAVFSCYFDIFDGLIQAFVFVFLTSLYIGEAVETE